jgi:hypothetical protein
MVSGKNVALGVAAAGVAAALALYLSKRAEAKPAPPTQLWSVGFCIEDTITLERLKGVTVRIRGVSDSGAPVDISRTIDIPTGLPTYAYIDGIPTGTYTITASKTGYVTVTFTLRVDRNTVVAFSMSQTYPRRIVVPL